MNCLSPHLVQLQVRLRERRMSYRKIDGVHAQHSKGRAESSKMRSCEHGCELIELNGRIVEMNHECNTFYFASIQQKFEKHTRRIKHFCGIFLEIFFAIYRVNWLDPVCVECKCGWGT